MNKESEKGLFDLIDALRAPILTHAGTWKDAIPQRILKIIPESRFVALLAQEQMATYPECVAFIMTATLEAPTDSDWTDIYTHVACQVLQDYFGEDHWEEVRAPRTLSEYQRNYLLNPLRRHIYERRRKLLKEQMKEDKKLTEKIEDQYAEMQKIPAVAGQQLSLF